MPKKRKRKNRESAYAPASICWDCKNALLGCSWSCDFVPVEGWEAVKSEIINSAGKNKATQTYRVVSCPEFVRG